MACIRFGMVVLSVLTVFLGGCAGTLRQPLSQANLKQVHSSAMIVNTSQREIKPMLELADANASASNGGFAGGFLGSLLVTAIDHVEVKHAERDIAPVRSVLDNFRLMDYFMSRLRNKLLPLHQLKIYKSENKFGLSPEKKKLLIKKAGKNSILFIDLDYGLNDDFNILQLLACASLQHQDASKSDGVGTLYSECVGSEEQLNLKDPTRQKSIALWTAHNGRLIKSSLRNSFANIATMLAMDITNPNAQLYAKLSGRTVHFTSIMSGSNTGKVIANLNNGGLLVRSSDGYLYSLNRYAVKK